MVGVNIGKVVLNSTHNGAYPGLIQVVVLTMMASSDLVKTSVLVLFRRS